MVTRASDRAFERELRKALGRVPAGDWDDKAIHRGGGMPTPPIGADVVEMADHRVYWSTDNWQTATMISRHGNVRKLTGHDLDLARFLAVSKSSWAGNAS